MRCRNGPPCATHQTFAGQRNNPNRVVVSRVDANRTDRYRQHCLKSRQLGANPNSARQKYVRAPAFQSRSLLLHPSASEHRADTPLPARPVRSRITSQASPSPLSGTRLSLQASSVWTSRAAAPQSAERNPSCCQNRNSTLRTATPGQHHIHQKIPRFVALSA